ncbi:MAG: DUF296 domain-containing protein [bacterium]|nr:DUF296 domain-containing protein [bacterium]
MSDNWELYRLPTGSRVPDALVDLALKNRWRSAVCTGIGGVAEVELAYYDLASKTYKPIAVPGIVELASLHGNLTGPADESFWHLHAVVSDATGRCWAGHLNHCVVALTVEMAIWPSDRLHLRELDDVLGLRLLKQ